MPWLTSWKHRCFLLLAVLLSGVGLAPRAQSAPLVEASPRVAQSCPDGLKRRPFARVVTQADPLSIRSQPNGRVIGTVPKGWAVVPVQTDASKQWVKINSHFDRYDGGFASAPNFRIGWVAARYLKRLGNFCDKPENPMGLLHWHRFSQYSASLQANWLQMGDRWAVLRSSR